MADPEPIKNTLDATAEKLKNNSVKKNGGARPGAGRPKGKMNKSTLEAMKVKEAFNQRIMRHADDLFNAQFSLAVGEQVLMVKVKERDSKGKVIRVYHEQVTDLETIKQYLDYHEGENTGAEDPNDEDNFYYLTTRSANNMAIDSMVNRALGKVPDKLEVDGSGFFENPNLVIKVVGSKHEQDLAIGDDGLLHAPDDSGTGEGDTDTTERADA